LVRQEGEGLPSPFPREEVEELPKAGDYQGAVFDINDAVESAMADLLRVYRFRRPGLMVDGDVFATFLHSARALDIPAFGTPEALLHRIQTEQASINAMRRQGTLFNPENQEALSAYFEMAFHASLLYAWVKGYSRG
jgi:hypothetical protein